VSAVDTTTSETTGVPSTSGTPGGADPQHEIVTVGLISVLGRTGRFVAGAVGALWALLVRTVRNIAAFCENWLLDGKKAPHGLAVTRIMFGLAGLGILFSNWSTRLYSMGPGSLWNGQWAAPTSDFPKIWLFSLFRTVMPNAALYTAAYLLVVVLAVLFTLGWRFKIVLPIYFCLWVSLIESQDALGDQGDNMYRIALILLFFADPCQRWALDARRRRRAAAKMDGEAGAAAKARGAVKASGATSGSGFGGWARATLAGRPLLESGPGYQSLFHNLALVALTAQVCFVYASGALYKAGGAPWQHGNAVYAPLQTVQFGTWPELSDLVTALGPSVTVAAWGSIIIQMCFPMMLLTHPTRVIALIGIMGFHIGIAVLMGLPWFSLTMIAIDFVFITERTWLNAIANTKALWARAGVRA